MGKSVELLGLAALNIIVAMVLSVTFLAKTDAAAVSVSALTKDNVQQFITETVAVSGGQREDMDDYGITTYFMSHIADHGQFISTIEYDMPDMPSSARTLEMDKMNFISHVLQGKEAMNRHETAVQIEYIEIAANGKSAMVTSTNYERGVMPVQDAMGEARMIPVTGTSYCEQEIVLSQKNIIQMAKADCSTNIDFADSY